MHVVSAIGIFYLYLDSCCMEIALMSGDCSHEWCGFKAGVKNSLESSHFVEAGTGDVYKFKVSVTAIESVLIEACDDAACDVLHPQLLIVICLPTLR